MSQTIPNSESNRRTRESTASRAKRSQQPPSPPAVTPHPATASNPYTPSPPLPPSLPSPTRLARHNKSMSRTSSPPPPFANQPLLSYTLFLPRIRLQILIRPKRQHPPEQDQRIQPDAQARGVACGARRRARAAAAGDFRDGVVFLFFRLGSRSDRENEG